MNKHSREPEFKTFRREEPLELAPGNLCTRLLSAKAIAAVRKARLEDVIEAMWPNDRVLKAATSPAMTSVTGWAKELAVQQVADAVDALSAYSSAIDVLSGSLVLTWDSYGQVSVPGFVASASNASFVAEGDPIPVRQLLSGVQSLTPHKVATIAALTDEMMESSNAEALISDTLIKSAALAIDAAFFGSAAASAAAPAGIRNGVATTPPSANADPFGAFFEDIAALMGVVGQVGGKGPYFLAASVGRAASMTARWFETGGAVEIVMSPSVGSDVVAIAGQAVAVALAPTPDVESSNTATLVMDTAPGAAGTGAEKGMFQTRSTAIKIRWPISWVLRDPRGVAWTTPAWK